ncbi:MULTISPECIES: DUF6232 family protein [unclassified Streptomyces]|uniref:DUF6232 family protein n=1 Tax=unclassified Streptomyces TaxID=2593676 RepID=UPI002E77368B|nr:DUF6232 family protein [Streptomyces sp. JV176]MEE1798639.1 DUF6232 family protein [Streptomyces sp. JV176]
MSYSRGITEVQVSRGVLWVGAETYPLRNIARTSMKVVTPNRRGAKIQFAKRLVRELILMSIAFGIMQASTFFGTVILLLALGLIARSIHELYRTLNAPTLHVLELTTSGSPQTALVSDDKKEMDTVFQQVMAAMDNPEIQFHYQMQTYNINGDSIYQVGDNNVGKVTT